MQQTHAKTNVQYYKCKVLHTVEQIYCLTILQSYIYISVTHLQFCKYIYNVYCKSTCFLFSVSHKQILLNISDAQDTIDIIERCCSVFIYICLFIIFYLFQQQRAFRQLQVNISSGVLFVCQSYSSLYVMFKLFVCFMFSLFLCVMYMYQLFVCVICIRFLCANLSVTCVLCFSCSCVCCFRCFCVYFFSLFQCVTCIRFFVCYVSVACVCYVFVVFCV